MSEHQDYPEPLRALSLWQPWASALVLGLKEHETRSWPMPHCLSRRVVAIHAALRKPTLKMLLSQARAWELVAGTMNLEAGTLEEQLLAARESVPYGAIVGVVTFGESQRILEPVAMNFGHSDVLTSDGVHRLLGKADRELGDFRPGRYMWRAHSARTLNYPIAQRGYQGAFALPRAVRLQVLDALAAGEIVKP